MMCSACVCYKYQTRTPICVESTENQEGVKAEGSTAGGFFSRLLVSTAAAS